MAKSKTKKKKLSDTIHNKKKTSSTKPLSPFEVHINREKMRIIGRKNKHNKGLPGESRAKAIDKRKKTLLEEYKIRNKSNKFVDRRIGENDHSLSTDQKQMARFAAVRVKSHKRKQIFNLGDDEVLTHKGQSLNEIEQFEDPRSEDEDDGETETGKLDEKFVEEAHFGGGLLRKTGQEGARSHKDLIAQLIAESKKRKAEKQRIKEATMELTEKLDTEWKDLQPLVNIRTNKTEDVIKPKVDDYDKVMRELKFEARGTVSDRLKSEEEIAKEEKEKLEKLEMQRLERMKGITEVTKVYTHRSADDLDDDLVYEPENEITLSYDNDGQSNLPIARDKVNDSDLNVDSNEEVLDEEEISEDESGSNSEDDLSDLKAESSNSEEENVHSDDEQTKLNQNVQIKDELLKIKKEMDKARAEVPYTFPLPNNYEEFQNTLKKYSNIHQSIVVERVIKCNHSSLAKGNKANLGLLFAYILQYIDDCASEALDEESIKNCFDIFSKLTPHLFDLAQMNQSTCHNSMVEVIKEKFQGYWKKPKVYPGLEILLFLKIVSLLFTTSDFRHQVVTPCLIFMEEMLTRCHTRTRRDVSFGLFLSTLVLEYTSLSKRVMPGCINFLGGIIHMAIPKCTVRIVKVLPPFNSLSSDLVLLESQTLDSPPPKMDVTDLVDGEITESFKLRALYTALKLLYEFFNNFKDFPSKIEIFQSIYDYCNLLQPQSYPNFVRSELKNFLNEFETAKTDRKLQYVAMAAKKPKALRLYEPKIVEVYDGKRHKVQSREKAERDKLIHKLKREKKGALREIRRDNAFLGRIKIKQQIQSDKERREKVKRIFAEASIQQAELNALDRKKAKK